MNKLFIIGNLTADPDYTVTTGGTPVCRFTVAVNRKFKREGAPDADFFRVSTFNKSAENCGTYLAKGRKVGVTGPIQFDEYTDKEGIRRQSANLLAEEVEFLSPKETGSESKPIQKSVPLTEVKDETLPF